MSQTNILVTGGCGFLGTSILSALHATSRFTITAIDINPPSPGTTTFASSVRYVRANVLNPEALQKVFHEARPAIVVHTVGVNRLGAARYSMKNTEDVFRVNVEGTRNVIHAAKECGAKGLVYTSSVTVVLDSISQEFRNVDERWPTGNVDTAYGISKVTPTSYPPPLPSISISNPQHKGPRRIPSPTRQPRLLPHLLPAPRPHPRPHRHRHNTHHTLPHRPAPNAFHTWHRHKPPGLRVHRQRR